MCHPLTDSSGVPINSSPLANTSDTSTTTRPLVSATSGPSISQPSTSTVPTPSSNSTGNTFPTTPWTSVNHTGEEGGEGGLGAKVVRGLVEPLNGKGHHIYYDNFSSSVALAKEMAAKGNYTISTTRFITCLLRVLSVQNLIYQLLTYNTTTI
jgi:hypothetical protein